MSETTERTPAEVARAILDIIEKRDFLWRQAAWFSALGADHIELNGGAGLPVERWLKALSPDASQAACGTTACVAGWAAVLTAPIGSVVKAARIWYPDGTTATAEDIGARALGIGYFDANWLFSALRSKEQVTAALRALAKGEAFDANKIMREFPDEWNEGDDEIEDGDEE